jgi:hypothetical protein
MEWQEEDLNAVAIEEADFRDEDVALLGNYDSEDKEDLAIAFAFSHAEKRQHLEENEAVHNNLLHDMEDALLVASGDVANGDNDVLPVTNLDNLDNNDTKLPALEGAPVVWKIPGPSLYLANSSSERTRHEGRSWSGTAEHFLPYCPWTVLMPQTPHAK